MNLVLFLFLFFCTVVWAGPIPVDPLSENVAVSSPHVTHLPPDLPILPESLESAESGKKEVAYEESENRGDDQVQARHHQRTVLPFNLEKKRTRNGNLLD